MTNQQLRHDEPAAGDARHNVPLLDVNRENLALQSELLAAFQQVCSSGRFILGPECEQLERRLAERLQVAHAVGCASGSDALLLTLMAIDLQSGDEVILPSFTFFATASAVWRLGGIPVFVDIDPRTFNIDVNRVDEAITPHTKAIIPVHLFGQAADMDGLMAIARSRRLSVIEDAAQAIGSAWNSRPVGSIGDMGCLSFYPTKNLGGFGDGGMLTTNDDALADRLRLLRAHGMQPRYHHRAVGINSRLDTLQAALLNVKLHHLDAWTAARQQNAVRYHQWIGRTRFAALAVGLPATAPAAHHVWNQFTIRVAAGKRDALRSFLTERGIGTEVYYPVPLHQQVCFRALGPARHPLAETERAAAEVLSLPISPTLTNEQQQAVVETIDLFFARQIRAPHRGLPTSLGIGHAIEMLGSANEQGVAGHSE